MNTPTETVSLLGTSAVRRDHPVLHPHLRYGEAHLLVRDTRAAHEGYSGLEVDEEDVLPESPLPRRGVEDTLRRQREEQQEILRGWASL